MPCCRPSALRSPWALRAFRVGQPPASRMVGETADAMNRTEEEIGLWAFIIWRPGMTHMCAKWHIWVAVTGLLLTFGLALFFFGDYSHVPQKIIAVNEVPDAVAACSIRTYYLPRRGRRFADLFLNFFPKSIFISKDHIDAYRRLGWIVRLQSFVGIQSLSTAHCQTFALGRPAGKTEMSLSAVIGCPICIPPGSVTCVILMSA